MLYYRAITFFPLLTFASTRPFLLLPHPLVRLRAVLLRMNLTIREWLTRHKTTLYIKFVHFLLKHTAIPRVQGYTIHVGKDIFRAMIGLQVQNNLHRNQDDLNDPRAFALCMMTLPHVCWWLPHCE